MIKLKRVYTCPNYTIGKLYINDKHVCDTLEDTDRGLDSNMSLDEILSKKVYGKTAIPTGTYPISLNIYSPSKGSKEPYKSVCNGFIPRLLNVPGYSGVLIHIGNTQYDTNGCILVGLNKSIGKVSNSRSTFCQIYKQLKEEANKGPLMIKIERVYEM